MLAPPDPLVIQSFGLLAALDVLRQHWMPGTQIGLGAADAKPDQTTTLAVLQPCSWSGYPGLLTLGFWGGLTLVGPRALLVGPPVTYTHNGGPMAQTVITYYLTDALGNLLLAQRLTQGPVPMFAPGQQLTVVPRFTFRSEY